MAKKTNVKIDGVAAAIQDILQEYADGVEDGVERVTKRAMDNLVDKTRATAPVLTGSYRKNITSEKVIDWKGSKYVWYVKAPDHRLTHLLVHGHATRNGGRSKKFPFLQNALNSVLSQYEQDLQEAIKNGK